MFELNEPIIPMQPILYPSPFDDINFGFQVKWDGIRIMAHIDNGNVRLFNRRKKDKTLQYFEINKALADYFPTRKLILDGEMVALLDGKPNFNRILRRDLSKDMITIKSLIERIPATFVIFDILYLDGRELIDLPFVERNELLKNIVKLKHPIITTDTFLGRGNLLFDIIKKRGLEGIVAKRLDSPYEIGKKSKNWLKIKNRQQINAYIGGYITKGKKVKSLLLGLYSGDELLYIGKAATGLTENMAKKLFENLKKNPFCPFANFIYDKNDDIFWVEPTCSVKVEFLDFTEKGHLRHPTIVDI